MNDIKITIMDDMDMIEDIRDIPYEYNERNYNINQIKNKIQD